MSTIYLPPEPAAPLGPEHGQPWPGPGSPGGPGGGGGTDGRSPRRRRWLAAIAAVVVVAGAATAGTTLATGSSASPVLTTAQIQSKVSPALVDINTTLGLQGGAAAGTGIVLTSTGEVLTNNHVIDGATRITATDVGNGRTYQAKVVGYDESADVAVIKLQGASGLQTAALGNSGSVRVGQRVVALGNAGGKGGAPSVATGKVTALHRDITATDQGAGTSEQLTGLVQTNADIQPGDSGGPLVNTAGQVVGMNTAASSSFRFTSQPGNGSPAQAFAIPVGTAKTVAGQIQAGTSSATVHLGPTAFLGVGLAQADRLVPGAGSAHDGATIDGVVSGSPAARAGLAPGDVITSIGGTSVTSPADVESALTRYHPGDRVSVTWTGQLGQSHTATVALATGPAA